MNALVLTSEFAAVWEMRFTACAGLADGSTGITAAMDAAVPAMMSARTHAIGTAVVATLIAVPRKLKVRLRWTYQIAATDPDIQHTKSRGFMPVVAPLDLHDVHVVV